MKRSLLYYHEKIKKSQPVVDSSPACVGASMLEIYRGFLDLQSTIHMVDFTQIQPQDYKDFKVSLSIILKQVIKYANWIEEIDFLQDLEPEEHLTSTSIIKFPGLIWELNKSIVNIGATIENFISKEYPIAIFDFKANLINIITLIVLICQYIDLPFIEVCEETLK